MDFKFSKNTEPESKQSAPVEKGRQNGLLLLLLILVAGFSYLYFFTGLIRPQQAQTPAEAPAPQVVRKPLPSPADQAAAVPVVPGQTAASTTPTTPETPRSTTASPPGGQEAKKSEQVQKPVSTAPVEKKSMSASAAPAAKAKPMDAKKPVAGDSKTAATPTPEKKSVSAAAPKKESVAVKVLPKEKAPSSVAKTKKATVAKPVQNNKPSSAPVAGAWTVVVGTYMLEDAMATDMIRVRKAGLDAFVQAGPPKRTSMNRLYLSEFDDRGAALAESNKLKRHTSDAFVLDQGGKFGVYAGSYLLDARAASEKERLAAAGFHLTLKKIDIAIPTKKLIAGRFSDKAAAESALSKLKGAGLQPALVKQ